MLRQVELDRWSNGRVAPTSDAAWYTTPISGIGITLAVVGAYVLAGEEGQSVSRANQIWTHPRIKFGIAVQNAVLGVLSKPGIRDAFLKIGMRESTKIELPE